MTRVVVVTRVYHGCNRVGGPSEKLMVKLTDQPTDRANIVQSAFSKVGK